LKAGWEGYFFAFVKWRAMVTLESAGEKGIVSKVNRDS